MTSNRVPDWLPGYGAGGIRWGLERTEELLAGVGNPDRLFHSIHIGGTNGKGSVAALCDAALRTSGHLRIGLYTSPHLVSFAERIRIDGKPISPEALEHAAERLRPLVECIGASFFEATTALAFLCFADAGIDLAVVEVGLGGRLDATNVISPVAVAITNVALDHTEYLGTTLPQIAGEKAGILKPGVRGVTAERDPEILALLRSRAAEVGAPFAALEDLATPIGVTAGAVGTTVHFRSKRWGEGSLQTLLRGEHQARNILLAAELLGQLPEELQPSRESMERGFASARWPGRLQVERLRGTTWVFDVAHNPAGAAALVSTLDRLQLPQPVILVMAVLADKAWAEMLNVLLSGVDASILSLAPSSPPDRRWNPDVAAQHVATLTGRRPRVIPELADALERAATLAPHGTVLVTGSFHTVGDAMQYLGISPF